MKEAADLRKVTALLPADLLDRAMELTGEGVTPTLRQGLEMMSRHLASQRLLGLRGKLKLAIDVDELRQDRDE
ncbi:MAG: hypothetical protein NTV70_21060 [Acidobacteria bacterium]|nr:hypothetical protein [Acidobacteriota bacterium]MCX6598851.1 hypothetical protein [Acidobacteriota bacterium]